MDWKPNLEAVSTNEIWPELQKNFSSIHLHIAGRKMPSWIIDEKMEGVTNHGEVESANEFMNNDIMLVPLLSAGGMRVKIIEGMALENSNIN